MNYSDEKRIIDQYFEANWPHTPIVFENGESREDGEWVRLSIQNGRAFQATLGDSPSFRHPGVVFVQIFTATDIGSGRALALADAVEQLFKAKNISGIQFGVPSVQRVNGDDEWFQINVSTEFYRGS